MLFWEDMITLISMLEVLLFLMSLWTFILNHLDLNIHATIKKITLRIMLGSIPHQKFCFYHLPTRGRAGIKLGDAWYVSNVSIIFDCSMLLYYPFWMFMGFILHIYIIFGTNLLTGGPARIAVFCLFQNFEEKEYQTESKCHETSRRFFMDQKEDIGPWLHLGGVPRRGQPTRARQEAQARPGGLFPPQVPQDRLFAL